MSDLVERDLPWLPVPNTSRVRVTDLAPPGDLVTAAFALAFDDSGRLLCAQVRTRGVDVVGGHVEAGESPEGAAVRETREETGVEVVPLGLAGVRELRVEGEIPPGYRYPAPLSYHTFHVARVVAVGPREMPDECDEPVWISPDEVGEHPRLRPFAALIAAAARMARRAARDGEQPTAARNGGEWRG